MPSPHVWQHPPRPADLFLPDDSDFSSTPDRTWHRTLWSSEAAMASVGLATAGFPDMFMSAHLQVGPAARPFTTSVVREALRSLRFEHPVIATRLACSKPAPGGTSRYGQPRLVYEAPVSEEDVAAWLNDIAVDRSDALEKEGTLSGALELVRRELGAALVAYRPSQLDVHYILEKGDRGMTLVVRFGHAAFDGVGCFVFLNLIIKKIAEVRGSGSEMKQLSLSWGEEVVRLAPSVVDNMKIPWDAEEAKNDTTMCDIMADAIQRIATRKAISLHTPHPFAPPTYTGFYHRVLLDDVVQALVRQARAHECTFFSVAYSAALLSTLAITQPKDVADLAVSGSTVPANLRDRGILINDHDVPSALGCAVVDPDNLERFKHDGNLPALDEVWTLAKEVNAQTRKQLPWLPKIALWGEQLDVFSLPADIVEALFKRDMSRVASPSLSSFGVMDNHLAPRHGDVVVSQPCLTIRCCNSGPPTGPLPGFHVFTWQGTLYVNVSYPESVVGGYEEQFEALKSDAEAAGSLLQWVETYMETLVRLSKD